MRLQPRIPTERMRLRFEELRCFNLLPTPDFTGQLKYLTRALRGFIFVSSGCRCQLISRLDHGKNFVRTLFAVCACNHVFRGMEGSEIKVLISNGKYQFSATGNKSHLRMLLL